jgi:hypothetical protein
MFIPHGLSGGESVILVLAPSHRDLLLQRLDADAFDVPGLQHSGRLVLRQRASALCRGREGAPSMNASYTDANADTFLETMVCRTFATERRR